MRLEIARINRIPRFISENAVGMGNGVHIIIASAKAIVGASKKRICDDVDGRMGSLINSFTPSAIG